MVDPYRVTDDWQEGYDAGYESGFRKAMRIYTAEGESARGARIQGRGSPKPKPKRKLSAWNRFVKANSKKPRFVFKSNTATHKKGQLNLKKMGVAFHKTPEGKASKKRR